MFRFARRCTVAVLALCSSVAALTQSSKKMPSLPLVFEANRGQIAPVYAFRSRHNGLDARFRPHGMEVLLGSDVVHPLRIDFVGSHAVPEGKQPLTGHTNYFLHQDRSLWLRDVQLVSEVEYPELYRGVSLSFYGNDQELEHDFRVDPGADPSSICMHVRGASGLHVQSDGDLAVVVGNSTMVLRRPVAYQPGVNGRAMVEASFRLSAAGDIRFFVGRYDHSKPLILDPVMVFSTYLGGTGTDEITGVTTDPSGNILVTGYTTSTDFPTKNPLQSGLAGADPYAPVSNVFITKLDPTGKTLIFSTYLGGSRQDSSAAIAPDPAGNVIVSGTSLSNDFPHAGNMAAATCQTNDSCYFLASLKPDGSALNFSGLIHGNQGFYTNATTAPIAVDASGSVYLAGVIEDSTFQVTPGTLSSAPTSYPYDEMFVQKVDATGRLVYATVVPGNASNDPLQVYNNSFWATGIAVDASGRVTMAGRAGLGLPTTSGVVGPQFPNAHVNVESPSAGFVLQINPTGTAVNFASYLPGTDGAGALAVDGTGNFWIAGETGEANLPTSANAYQKTIPPYTNAGYVMEVTPNAGSVLAATYLNQTSFSAMTLDSKGNVLLGGMVAAGSLPFQNPFVTKFGFSEFNVDMILVALSSDLHTLEFSSYLNSMDDQFGGSVFAALAVDAQDRFIVAGNTSAADFPTTTGSFQPKLPNPVGTYRALSHAFLAKIDLSTPAPSVCFDTFSLNLGSVNAKTSASQTTHVTNCGNAPLTISSIASSDPTVAATQSCGSIPPGGVCPVQITFTPVSSEATNAVLTFSDNALTLPQTVAADGQGIAPRIVPSDNPVSFGHVLAGTQGFTTSLSITNQGQVPLGITTVAVSGASFSLVSQNCAQVVLSRTTCEVQIVFTPKAPGPVAGSLTIASNDPVTPLLVVPLNGTGDSIYGVPVISNVSAPTVLINNGPVTETITGINFYPGSVAQLNGVPLATTVMGNTGLSAIIPANALTSLGEQTLTVVNPQPGGGTSPSVTITPYQTLLIDPGFLVSVPATGLLYAAIPSSATNTPNTIIPIDPKTGTTQTPIPVGQGPGLLAPSSDGSYLFVGDQTDSTVQRVNLRTNAVERTFPYTPSAYCATCSLAPADDLAVVPGSPQEVILSQGETLTLYNDAGAVNHVPNDGICCYADPNFGSIALAGNPLTIYGLPFLLTGTWFQTASLTPSGLSYTRMTEANYGGNNTTGNQVISDGTLLYTSKGEIWDPSTMTEVGTFPVLASNTASYLNDHAITLDTSLGELYAVGTVTQSSANYVQISAFGLKSHVLNGTVPFPQIYWPTENNLVRWGTDGLAFIGPGIGLTDEEVYLFRSSVVSPVTPNPTPVLQNILPVSAAPGGQDLVLTANGTGFLANSVIDWNGIAVSTTFVSGQQLTAIVPASATAGATTAQVAVYTPGPGGGSSVSLTFTVAASKAVASLSAATLNFPDTALKASSDPMMVTLTNTGSAPLALTAISATGDYAVSNDCGSTLAAAGVCNLAIVFTPTAMGAREGTLTLTDSAQDSPQIVTLTGNGLAAAASLSASGLTFAGTPVGVTSSPQVLVLTNAGNTPLAVAGVTATGDFSVTNTCGTSLAAGATCNIMVAFKPTVAGTRDGTLTLIDNAGNSPQSVTLSGNGLGAFAALSASSLTFPDTAQGVPSTAQIAALTNTGNAPLSLTGVSATGDFSVSNTCGSSLAAGVTCNLAVVFTPTATGGRRGTLTLADNATNAPQAVSLAGNGVTPFAIAPAQTGATASTVPTGGTADYALSLASSGGYSGLANLSCSGAPQYATCTVTPATINVISGVPTSFTVSVVTTTTVAASNLSSRRGTLAGLASAPLLGLCWLLRRRQRFAALSGLALGLLLMASGLSGCAGSNVGSSTQQVKTLTTPPGVYHLVITAASSSFQTTQSLTLTVN